MGLTTSTKTVGAVARRHGRPLVIGLLGVVALVSASCAGGGQPRAIKPVHSKASALVKTDSVTSTTHPPPTTTTTAPDPKTSAGTFVPAVQPAPAPAPATTTTTTDPLPPGCVWTDFAAKVSTDQGSYSAGQPVQITLVLENAGPACTVNSTGYACPLINIDNSAGALVWSSAAPISTGCPSTFTGPTVLAANWSQSFPVTWGQDACTPGQAACPGPQVPPGSYRVTGMSGGGSSQIPAGPPVVINLAAA
jgi:hypothetical protein